MSAAPRDHSISRTIRGLLEELDGSAELIVFIGRNHTVLARTDPSLVTPEQLRAKRAELLDAGTLKAVAHIGAAYVDQSEFRWDVRISLIEVFNDLNQATIHALVTLPNQVRWIRVPDEAMEYWIQVWTDGEENTNE